MISEFNRQSLPIEHYLSIAKELGHNYFSEFLWASEKLKAVLKPSEFKTFWNHKMQLNKGSFNEAAFIQAACETAVANHFVNKSNFKVEIKTNPASKKNIDCQFTSQNFTYNIEVKCSSFERLEKEKDSTSYIFETFGRIPDHEQVTFELLKILNQDQANPINSNNKYQEAKKLDNVLKDFLESAHKKFNSTCSDEEVNILLVCCDDRNDMQNWYGYLTANEGLLTEQSFADPANYNNVDLVILTNLYFKHKNFHKKRLKNSWSLEETLNLIFCNPFRIKEKNSAIVNFFTKELINYTVHLLNYKVPGFAPDHVNDAVLLHYFVMEQLEKEQKLYLFETL